MSSSSGTMDHTADLKFWVEADSVEELFSSAALALSELMYQGPRTKVRTWLVFNAQGADQVDLLVRLLSEVVYLADAEDSLVAAVDISAMSPKKLATRLGVVALDQQVHTLNEPIKAVTYHQASLAVKGSRWRCEIVLDI